MTKDIPDYMRGFDLTDDWGMTPVSAPPKQEVPVVDTKPIENASLEISKVKADVSSIKSMMNEVMQIVAEKDTITKEVSDEDQKAKMKELEKIILCDVQIEIYPDLEKALLDLLHNSGYPAVKFEKKVDFQDLYNQRSN